MRYSRKDAEGAFSRLCDALGKRQGAMVKDDSPRGWSWDIGAWRLDYSPYGGFYVEEINNEFGGVSAPLGHLRRPAREFCEAVRFAIDALYVKEEN